MHALVVSGGALPRRTGALPRRTGALPRGRRRLGSIDYDLVVAADSGFDRCVALGLDVDTLIGDLDSISADGLARARRSNTEIIQLNPDKDATDLAVAMGHALDRGATEITVWTGVGERLDHLLAELLSLTEVSARVTAMVDGALVQVANPATAVTVDGTPGDLVTLLAVHGPASGVTTTGLRWALDDATLQPGSTLGVSNVLTARHATVRVACGRLLVIQPAEAGQ
jgi:thiamine pyrophosphokinase